MESAPRGFFLFVLLFVILLSACDAPAIQNTATPEAPAVSLAPVSEVDESLEEYFQGFEGCFVLYDLEQQQYLRYNPERCSQRFLPASTFKILNSLISLETGVIEDENEIIPWDGKPKALEMWNRDYNMRDAIKDSAVWFYQELARRVGRERMQQYVSEVGYGNEDISGNIDSFWLDGALRISPDEQVEFLQRLYRDDLPFSQRSLDIVRDILVLRESGTYRFSGKTGSAVRQDIKTGWFVGCLQKQDDTYFFVVNIDASGVEGMENGMSGRKAKEIAWDTLVGLELIP